MTNIEVQNRIDQINALLEVKQAELGQRSNRRKELEHRQTANTKAKQQFITRIKLDIKNNIEEINNLKTELWGLQELQLNKENR